MTNKITIQKILDRELLKDLANQMVDETITDVIVIYRDPKTKSIVWNTTIDDFPLLFGIMEITQCLIRELWQDNHEPETPS